MIPKLIIGFDIDGVIYPWHEEIWKWFIRRGGETRWGDGTPISFREFWKWPDGWIANNEGSAIVKRLVKEVLPYVTARANEADVSIIHDMVKDFNAEIYYITSRPMHLHYDTGKWLKDNKFPFADNLIMADENGGKVKVVEDVGCDYFVEDRPKYLTALAEITLVLKMVTPYNTYAYFPAKVVGNIYEVYDHIARSEKHDNV